jgi:hypothetical protein
VSPSTIRITFAENSLGPAGEKADETGVKPRIKAMIKQQDNGCMAQN